ncbi:MAG: hypothetical protein ACI9YT_000495 [Halobacteriales archaeon]|jgi:hypothetical protein
MAPVVTSASNSWSGEPIPLGAVHHQVRLVADWRHERRRGGEDHAAEERELVGPDPYRRVDGDWKPEHDARDRRDEVREEARQQVEQE